MYSYERANALLDDIDDERDSFGEVFRIKKLLDNEHRHSENLLFESLRLLQLMELPVDAIKATSILSSVKRMRGNINKRIKDQQGGGQVFKSLQRLVHSLKNGMNTMGAVLVENEGNVSCHLKHCALENNLQTVPASWIVNSLFSGKLLPLKKDHCAPLHRIKMPAFCLAQDDDMSEEI